MQKSYTFLVAFLCLTQIPIASGNLEKRGFSEVLDGAGEAVGGLFQTAKDIITDPLDAVDNAVHVLAHPIQSAKGVYESLREGCPEEDRDKCIGKTGMNIALFGLTTFAGPLAAGNFVLEC